MRHTLSFVLSALCLLASASAQRNDDKAVRVFIFAGQSNMVGADSKVADIERFPPFAGLGAPQEKVRFWHCIGRENKTTSDGWTALQPVRGMVGPELSFAMHGERSPHISRISRLYLAHISPVSPLHLP